MGKKKLEEPEKWITVNGVHLPVYPGGRIGQPGQKEINNNEVALERKVASALKKQNTPDSDKEAYNMIQAYKKGQISPESLKSLGVTADELKTLSDKGRKEALQDVATGKNVHGYIDPMGNLNTKKVKSAYEKNYGKDFTKMTKEQARKELEKSDKSNSKVSIPGVDIKKASGEELKSLFINSWKYKFTSEQKELLYKELQSKGYQYINGGWHAPKKK